MTGTWPVHLPQVASARVYSYLVRGKDHFRSDRECAEQMVAAHPGHVALARENEEYIDRAVADLVEEGVEQLLVLGCGLPRPPRPPLHRIAQTTNSAVSTVYLDRDPSCVVTTRAHHHHNDLVTVLDGDLADPQHMLADPALQDALAPDRPVGVVASLTAQHLEGAALIALATALAAALPVGSRIVLTHPSGADADLAADVYRTAIREGRAVEDTYLTRSVDELAQLFTGWTVAAAEVSEHGLLMMTARLP